MKKRSLPVQRTKKKKRAKKTKLKIGDNITCEYCHHFYQSSPEKGKRFCEEIRRMVESNDEACTKMTPNRWFFCNHNFHWVTYGMCTNNRRKIRRKMIDERKRLCPKRCRQFKKQVKNIIERFDVEVAKIKRRTGEEKPSSGLKRRTKDIEKGSISFKPTLKRRRNKESTGSRPLKRRK